MAGMICKNRRDKSAKCISVVSLPPLLYCYSTESFWLVKSLSISGVHVNYIIYP